MSVASYSCFSILYYAVSVGFSILYYFVLFDSSWWFPSRVLLRRNRGQNLLRRTCHVSSLPTPHRQAPFVPSGPPGLRGTHLRFAAPHPLRPVIHKVHLALLRVTPQAPRNGGMCSAPRAKEEIVHPASFGQPSAASAQLRSTLSAPGFPHSASFTNSPLSARCGWRLLPPRQRISRLCAPLTGQPRLRQPARPSPSGSSTQIRLKRCSRAPEARLIRTAHASPVEDSLRIISRPGRSSSGGLRPTLRGYGCLRPQVPCSSDAYAFRNLVTFSIGHYVPSL